MEREELLRITAKRYAEAQAKVEDADQRYNEAERLRNESRGERDALSKQLEDFVGRNIPRKVVSVGDCRAVLIQMDLTKEITFVSVEKVL
jgi:hypothetical protein